MGVDAKYLGTSTNWNVRETIRLGTLGLQLNAGLDGAVRQRYDRGPKAPTSAWNVYLISKKGVGNRVLFGFSGEFLILFMQREISVLKGVVNRGPLGFSGEFFLQRELFCTVGNLNFIAQDIGVIYTKISGKFTESGWLDISVT